MLGRGCFRTVVTLCVVAVALIVIHFVPKEHLYDWLGRTKDMIAEGISNFLSRFFNKS